MLVGQNSNIFEQLIQAYVARTTRLGAKNIEVRAYEDLRFIELNAGDKGVTVIAPTTYRAPSEVDILFIDNKQKKSYVIYIMEVNDDVLGSVFDDLRNLTIAYFSDAYSVVEKKGLFTKATYLNFTDPHLLHKTATRTKKFQKQGSDSPLN